MEHSAKAESGAGHGLKQTLSTWHLWGIAVGLVISGEYFGWSYGWDKAGTLGFVVTTVFIAIMYTTFIFSFTELPVQACAGGPFSMPRGFGPVGGAAGMALRWSSLFSRLRPLPGHRRLSTSSFLPGRPNMLRSSPT